MANEETIFAAALAKGAGAERDAYLDQACAGDTDLRRAVDALLHAHARAGGILESPPVDLSATRATDPATDAAVGSTVGRYKLLEQIGGGGMGVVYMAEQLHPVRRKVALKIIKPGMDSQQVIARFEAERQALTMMEHPSIAKVLDAGTTDAGRPFFVMELVKGIPITDYCDQAKLTTDARLELFVQVCHAVQHAHQKGVIHRDLKPSNVLVTLIDDKPVPKVIDFGIAKATGQTLTERTLFTQYAQMLGTPLYMSPEQAQISGTDVDTRSDVYSLGVLLYELLTGTTPFDKHRLREAAYDEMRRIIREEDPPRPSTRLSTCDTLPSIAANRHTDPGKLTGQMRGELDWIVMKTLEKDRARRYETPNGLAADVLRFLNDEAVQAFPPSAVYRFRKVVRRNKGAFFTAGVIAAALVLAVIVLGVSNTRITRERNQKAVALKDREEALKEKGAALQLAQASEKDARYHEALARRRFYAAQMNLAMQAWDAQQPARTLQLLESQRPRFDQEDLRGFDWYYLWRLCQGAQRFSLPTRAYDNGSAIAISPDGKTLATGFGLTVRLWDVETGRQTAELPGHDHLINRLAFSPDGKILAATDELESVRLWDPATGKLRLAFKPGKGMRGVQFAGDNRTLALGGKTLKLWDTVANQEVASFGDAKVDLFWDVAVSPDGKTLVAVERNAIRVWNREGEDWREGPSLAGLGYYAPLAMSPDGKLLAVGYSAPKLYDLPNLRERITLTGHTGTVYALRFSGDGKHLASGGMDRTVRTWDVASGKQLACIANPGPIYGLAVTPDASAVAAMGTDAIRVWNVAPAASATVLHRPAPVRAISFSPDGKTLAWYAEDGTKLWDMAQGREIMSLPTAVPQKRWFFGLVFSPDGKLMAIPGADDSSAEVLDLTGGQPRVVFRGIGMEWAFSPDGKSLASACEDGNAVIWDLQSQQRRFTMPVSKIASVIAYSPDGKILAAGGQFGVLKLFDAQTGQERNTLQRFMLAVDWVRVLAFSPDGRKLASGNRQGVVHIWDVASNQLDASLIGHTDDLTSLAFTDGGKTLATASIDCTIRLWDVATGQERITLKGHTGGVTGVSFNPEGNILATSSHDGTVRLWHAAVDADATARKREIDPDDAQSPAANNERGDRLWQYGRVDEAAEAYRQALDRLEKLRPAFPDEPAYPQEMVRTLLSLSLLRRVELQDPGAEPARLRALDLYRGLSPEQQQMMFWAYRERHRNISDTGKTSQQQADRTFSQLLELIPQDDSASLIKAARFLANGDDVKLRDPTRAVECARAAIAAAVKIPNQGGHALLCLADVFDSTRRRAEAIDVYQQAIAQFSKDLALRPEVSNTWTGRAFSHFHLKQWDEAIADFTKAIELDPTVHTNWLHRGACYTNLAQWDKAASDYAKLVEKWPQDYGSWYVRAQIDAQRRRPADAVANLRQALAHGFTDVARIRNDPQLEPIRANDEFKKLVAELANRSP